MDRNFAGDPVLTNTNGEKTTVSKRGAAFTYDRSDWYLGLFAWSGIVIAFGYGTFTVFPQLHISFQKRNPKNEKQRGSNGASFERQFQSSHDRAEALKSGRNVVGGDMTDPYDQYANEFESGENPLGEEGCLFPEQCCMAFCTHYTSEC
jgi:hypothetical protein